jgi:hypothetical protein
MIHMFYRYELYIGDEYQGCISDNMESKMKNEPLMEANAIVDSVKVPTEKKESETTESWLTEDGMARYKESIDKLCDIYERQGLYICKCRTMDTLPTDNVLAITKYYVTIRK